MATEVTLPFEVICWDWKDSPRTEELDEAVRRFGEQTTFTYAETNSDEYCLIATAGILTPEQASKLYDLWEEYESRWDLIAPHAAGSALVQRMNEVLRGAA